VAALAGPGSTRKSKFQARDPSPPAPCALPRPEARLACPPSLSESGAEDTVSYRSLAALQVGSVDSRVVTGVGAEVDTVRDHGTVTEV
jgi:hypothetical protein